MLLFKNSENVIPCGLFSIEHIILLLITIICIMLALKGTKNMKKENVKKVIQISTAVLWILELIKIIFNVINYGFLEINKYVPLYFCSLILYAGIFSGFCTGIIKRVGDVFLSTGGIIAGITFLICPLTSLTTYPALHFISIHSFILHGTMLYIGLLVLITKYYTIQKQDIKYYFNLIIGISAVAYIINILFDSNLMFISKNYPNTFIEIIYNITGSLFPIVMVMTQAILPFYIVYGIYLLINKEKYKDNMLINDEENKKEEVYTN